MRNGLAAAPVDSRLKFAGAINRACGDARFTSADGKRTYQGASPALAYAIFQRETIRGDLAGWWNALTVISPDGGYGLGQPTPSASGIPLPDAWQNAYVNARHCIENHILPSEDFWAVSGGQRGDALVRGIAAEYNAGRSRAWAAHLAGDVDRATTDHDYASDVDRQYDRIIRGERPL